MYKTGVVYSDQYECCYLTPRDSSRGPRFKGEGKAVARYSIQCQSTMYKRYPLPTLIRLLDDKSAMK